MKNQKFWTNVYYFLIWFFGIAGIIYGLNIAFTNECLKSGDDTIIYALVWGHTVLYIRMGRQNRKKLEELKSEKG